MTDVSGQPIGLIFKGLTVQDYLTLEYENDTFSRNVGNYQSTLSNIPEEQIFHLLCGGNLRSRNYVLAFQGGLCYIKSDILPAGHAFASQLEMWQMV
jgi:hypothetical protein